MLDAVTAGLAAIWEFVKSAASWCWDKLVSGWRKVCRKFYNVVISFAGSIDEMIKTFALENNIPVEQLPPSFKATVDSIITETQEMLQRQADKLQALFVGLGRTAKSVADKMLSSEF